jgi:hypothetical protein
MSEIEELEYKRAAFQMLSSILGEVVPDFWKPHRSMGTKGAPEYHPSIVNTPSTNFRKWPVSGY